MKTKQTLAKLKSKLANGFKNVAVLFLLITTIAVIIVAVLLNYGIIKPNEGTKTYIIEAQAQEPEVEEIDEKQARKEKLIDFIWFAESTRGVNNYSKCKEQGLINEIGYGIPGNGKYLCFDNREEQFETLGAWIDKKTGNGYTDEELACIYNKGTTDLTVCKSYLDKLKYYEENER